MSYKHLYIVVLFALLFGASTMACECEGDECEFGAEMLDDDPMSAGPVVLKELIGKERMKELGVKEWPKWECEPKVFDMHYSEKEMCYFIKGRASISCSSGQMVTVEEGDFVTFEAGLDCQWTVIETVKKYYKFE